MIHVHLDQSLRARILWSTYDRVTRCCGGPRWTRTTYLRVTELLSVVQTSQAGSAQRSVGPCVIGCALGDLVFPSRLDGFVPSLWQRGCPSPGLRHLPRNSSLQCE